MIYNNWNYLLRKDIILNKKNKNLLKINGVIFTNINFIDKIYP